MEGALGLGFRPSLCKVLRAPPATGLFERSYLASDMSTAESARGKGSRELDRDRKPKRRLDPVETGDETEAGESRDGVRLW